MLRRMFGSPKKNVFFFGIVAVLMCTTFIKLPCPVCHGTGQISTSVNMDQVTLTDLQTSLKQLNADFCVGYTLFEYHVNVTVTNGADQAASGYISLLLKANSNGAVLNTQYMGVQVPGKSTVVDTFDVFFQTAYDQTQNVYVEADVDSGTVKCLVCGGSGKLALNLWFVAAGLKNSLANITKTESNFVPPPVVQFPSEG